MNLIEKINVEDISKVITYSQGIPNPKLDKLLNKWQTAKADLSEHFLKGEIMYTYPEKVHFEIGKAQKQEKFGSFVEMVYNMIDNVKYCGFLNYLDYLSAEDFYANCLSSDYAYFVGKDKKKIQKGTKSIKAFRYFIEDQALLAELQDAASRIVQENKIEGYLTFSIHPLDFLSSSENTYNWRSCHSLDGEYRAGNLSYICDKSTIIVYLSTEEKKKLPNFPEDVLWNSKKWRMLIHFDELFKVCFAGRQYPFFSEGALEVVKKVFDSELAPLHKDWFGGTYQETWCGWFNDYIENFRYSNSDIEVDLDTGRYFVMDGQIYDKYNVIVDPQNTRNFNDLKESSIYLRPYYMFLKNSYVSNIKIELGAEVPCLWCEDNYINGQDSMMCSDCECEHGSSDCDDYHFCDCCGRKVWYDDTIYVNHYDELICPECAEKETFICAHCGGRYYNYEKHWSEELKDYVCYECNKAEGNED